MTAPPPPPPRNRTFPLQLRQGCPSEEKEKKAFAMPTETKVHRDALCSVVKMGKTKRRSSRMVGGWWRLAVGGGWRLAVGGGWRLAVGGGWRLAVGGGWRLAVGG